MYRLIKFHLVKLVNFIQGIELFSHSIQIFIEILCYGNTRLGSRDDKAHLTRSLKGSRGQRYVEKNRTRSGVVGVRTQERFPREGAF